MTTTVHIAIVLDGKFLTVPDEGKFVFPSFELLSGKDLDTAVDLYLDVRFSVFPGAVVENQIKMVTVNGNDTDIVIRPIIFNYFKFYEPGILSTTIPRDCQSKIVAEFLARFGTYDTAELVELPHDELFRVFNYRKGRHSFILMAPYISEFFPFDFEVSKSTGNELILSSSDVDLTLHEDGLWGISHKLDDDFNRLVSGKHSFFYLSALVKLAI